MRPWPQRTSLLETPWEADGCQPEPAQSLQQKRRQVRAVRCLAAWHYPAGTTGVAGFRDCTKRINFTGASYSLLTPTELWAEASG